jgi:Cdc6-like AAA superfamily ATPase
MMEEGNPRQPMRIVVLDEMDFLITKDQQVLYNIF